MLAFRVGLVTSAPTGGLDFVLPLLLGAIVSSRASGHAWPTRALVIAELLAFSVIALGAAALACAPEPVYGCRLAGVWGNANANALTLVFPIVWAASLARRAVDSEHGQWRLFLSVPLLVLLVVLQLGTLSRAGYFCTAIAALTYFAMASKSRRRLALAIASTGVLAGLAAVGCGPLRERLGEMLSGVDLSLRHRWILATAMLGLVAERPLLGVGWEQLEFNWAAYLRPTNMNTAYGAALWPLELGAQTGLPTLWLVLAVLVHALTRFPRTEAQCVRVASLVGLAGAGLSHSFIGLPVINALFFFLTGSSLAAGARRELDGLMKSLGLAGAGALAVLLAGLAWVPGVRWREQGNNAFCISARPVPKWVLADCRSGTGAKGSASARAFFRQIAETGGTYYRITFPDKQHCEAVHALAAKHDAILALLIDDFGVRDPRDVLTCIPWNVVVTLRGSAPGDPVRVDRADCRESERPGAREWSLWIPHRGELRLPADRACATMLAYILHLEASGSDVTRPLANPECPRRGSTQLQSAPGAGEERRSDGSGERIDRAGVERLLVTDRPFADVQVVAREARLAWKVRDRFCRHIDSSIYVSDMVLPLVGEYEALPGWRQRFFFHYYPLVWGVRNESEAIRLILDDALWTAAVPGAPNPWDRPIADPNDLATYLVLACRAVGIAAHKGACRIHGRCAQYYSCGGTWICMEVERACVPIISVGRMPNDLPSNHAASAP